MTNSFQNTVSKKIVEDFLSNLAEIEADKDISKRLRDTIFEQGKFTETALRVALFDKDEND